MSCYQVKLMTKSNMIMTMEMNGYSFPQDAIAAAMAQTDAKSFISCVPIADNTSQVKETNKEFSYSYENSSRPANYINWNTDPKDLTRKLSLGEKIWWFIQATWIPTLILLFINPWASFAFTVMFGYWWFKKS